MELRLNIPWPPSANIMWRHSAGVTYLSKKYQDFINVAVPSIKSQLPQDFTQIPKEQEVEVTIVLCPDSNRSYDVDNRIKTTLDVITRAGVWWDDSQVRKITAWKCDDKCPVGTALVKIETIGDESKEEANE